MSLDLMNVFTALDWSKAGKETANLLSIAFNQNSRTGDRVARAVFDDGSVIYKIVTASGIVIQAAEFLLKITSTAQRDKVIKDLSHHRHTQQEIAAIMNISQSTVSNVLRKK